MITETGKVVAIEPDGLWVETIQQSACDACSAQKGCGQRLIARVTGHTSRIRVPLAGQNADRFAINQQVVIGIQENAVVLGSLMVYLIPLLTMVLGICLAPTEHFAIAFGVLGLLLGGVCVRWISWRKRYEDRYQPVLLNPAPHMS